MTNIYEGSVCIIEQDRIKEIVDKIKEEFILMMNIECWEKLQDIIYFKKIGGKVITEWSNFLDFVSANSKEIFDFEKFEDIIEDLEKKIKMN
jgi:hypothetical protein